MAETPEPLERNFLGLSPAGFHRNAYWEWDSAGSGAPALVAVHGLTRNGRDFDTIARDLSQEFRVICPDVVGRGKSDWLPQGSLYGYPQYLADAAALIARLSVDGVDWLGTSMGGLIGMMLAAQGRTPIRRLILNDVGPFIPKAALERIASYARQDPHFRSLREVEIYLAMVLAAFGPLTEEDWAIMARHTARPLPGGGYGLACDPAIADGLRPPFEDIDLWPIWDRVVCPVLILRGGKSDLLLPETAAEMVRRKPGTALVTFDECGHAPALIDAHQIAAVREWLEATPA